MQQTETPQSMIWLSSGEVIELMNLHRESGRKRIERMRKANVIVTRSLNSGLGRNGYEYLLQSLPQNVQRKYFQNSGTANVKREKEEVMLRPSLRPATATLTGGRQAQTDIAQHDKTDAEVFVSAYANSPEYNRKQYDKYMAIIDAAGDLKGDELKKFIADWNTKHPDYCTSYGRVMAAKNIFKSMGASGLLASYGKRAGISKIEDEDFEYFKHIYLKEGGPGAEVCWLSTYGNHVKTNYGEVPENFPKVSAFLRKVKKEIPEAAIFMARNGEKKTNRKYLSYVNRDYSSLKPGQVWVSDHKQCDQAVVEAMPKELRDEVLKLLDTFEVEKVSKKKDKPVYPWITSWSDFVTGKILSWSLHAEDPNSGHIFQTFAIAVEKFGIPSDIIIDNGKDYRCKDFAGGKRTIRVSVDEVKTRSLVAGLGIKVHFTQPYNAQSKNLERAHLDFKNWFDKGLPGYRGGNIVERPEALQKNINSGRILDITTYSELFTYFIENIFNKYESQGKNLNGKSRDEVWAKGFEGLPRVSEDALMMYCMRTTGNLTISRNGITVSRQYQLYYWAEWMHGYKGKQAYMRRHPNKYQESWVFDAATNEYLGKAYLNAWTCNALVQTDLEKEHLENLLKAKKREVKILQKYAETAISVSGREYIENLATGIAASSNYAGTKDEKKESLTFLKTAMDDAIAVEKMRKTGTDNIDLEMIKPIEKKKKEVKAWWE